MYSLTALSFQILKNDIQPARELCVEKDLSSFSRFTRDRYVSLPSLFQIYHVQYPAFSSLTHATPPDMAALSDPFS